MLEFLRLISSSLFLVSPSWFSVSLASPADEHLLSSLRRELVLRPHVLHLCLSNQPRPPGALKLPVCVSSRIAPAVTPPVLFSELGSRRSSLHLLTFVTPPSALFASADLRSLYFRTVLYLDSRRKVFSQQTHTSHTVGTWRLRCRQPFSTV